MFGRSLFKARRCKSIGYFPFFSQNALLTEFNEQYFHIVLKQAVLKTPINTPYKSFTKPNKNYKPLCHNSELTKISMARITHTVNYVLENTKKSNNT